MLRQSLRVLLLAGLLIFPVAASAAIDIPGVAVLSNHGPVACGPGPDC
jgi:hypothetical protein